MHNQGRKGEGDSFLSNIVCSLKRGDNMPVLRKEGLMKIWNWLKATITDEDIKWLKKYRGIKWNDFTKDNKEWEERFPSNVFELSYTIQDIVSAKGNYTKTNYRYGDGLPKFHLWEIAKILGLDVSENNLKWQLANRIIKELDRLDKEVKETYSKAPSVI